MTMITPNWRRGSLVALAAGVLLACGPVRPVRAEQPVAIPGVPDAAALDAALERGLKYLATTQLPDGSYEGGLGRTTAIVGLSGMAFLAKGYTPRVGLYRDVLNRQIDYIIGKQESNGYLGGNDGKMYAHSIATLFLAEASGMVGPERQAKVSEALGKAVKLILEAQKVKKQAQNQGGWRYTYNSSDSDMSCSGWAIMALRSARQNGALVPDKAIEDAIAYVRRVGDADKGCFGYNGPSSHTITLTGAALLCLELTGHHGEDVTLKAGNYILNTIPELLKQEQFIYGNYYNAQAVFQLGGKFWEKYAAWMYDYFLGKQNADGSWDVRAGDRTYGTSMCLLALAVPYRQLPIYQRDETVDERSDAAGTGKA
jgi:hypothetical protein